MKLIFEKQTINKQRGEQFAPGGLNPMAEGGFGTSMILFPSQSLAL